MKHTKKALLMSVVSLLLCLSMLVGTTFAWFTDSVSTGMNTINAGNLDVEVYYGDPAAKNSIQDKEVLFDDVELWEPGVVAYENLTVANLGSLALKYQLAVNFGGENTVLDANGNDTGAKLSQVLQVAMLKKHVDEAATDRDALLDSIEATAWSKLANFTEEGKLLPKTHNIDPLPAGATSDTQEYALVIWWEPSAEDNTWNLQNGKTTSDGAESLKIDLGIELVATQLEAEDDSFGNDYDANAPWTGEANLDWYLADPTATEFTIKTAEELAGLAAITNGTAVNPVTTFAATASNTIHDDFEGDIIKLADDVDLNGVAWTPIGRIGVTSTDFTYSFKGTFDGGNHTVSNLSVSNEGWAGLFGLAHGAMLKNVKLNVVDLQSCRMAGSLVGQLYGSIENCHVSGATIVVIPNAVAGGYDNGDKVGGIVGWIGDNGNNRTLTGCSVTDSDISAYRDVGGIAGYVASSTTVSGNEAKGDTTVTVDQLTNFYGEKTPNAGAIVGRDAGAVIGTNTVADTVVITATYQKDGLVLVDDGETVALESVPADYDETTVNVPEGVEAIAGYAFAYNTNVETVILPSTVTTLKDRAFRETSASTVVLNEGLTNISYQAFRDAFNVTEVVIPSTVTTISKEAFQNSGVTTLTVPATVTTIEYGGLRDMKLLETVVIEGNVDIPVYAFRACTNLRTVVLKGDDVTFGGGSRGMIFTNKENGDGSAITVYVANETVKERLLAADTAAKDYGGYTIVTDLSGVVESADSLIEALESGKDVVLMDDVKIDPAGMSNAYGTTGINVKNGQTIDGNGNVLDIAGAGGTWDSGISTTGGLIKNITVTGSFRGIFVNHNSEHSETVVLENVTIDGTVYTISCDQGNYQNLTATGSTFNGWTSYAATIGNVSFTNCSFGEGSGYAFCRPYAPTTFVGCDFEAGFEMDPRAAVTFENCTIGGVALTADNLETLVTYNIANASVK